MFESQNESFNIKFVRAVEKYPVLYDFTRTDYSKKEVTQKAWSEIAKEFQLSEAECREKWKNLRIIFSRDLKKPETYSGTKFRRRPYYLRKDMQFLLPFMKISTPEQKSQEIQVNDSAVLVQLDCSKLKNQSVNSSQPANSPQHAKIQDSPCSQSNYKNIKFNIKDNVRNTDKALSEYSAAKKPKLITLPTDNKKESALQQFLNSLMPDLMSMTDTQLRSYKQNTILLIDEILGTAPVEVYCTQELSTGISLNIPQSQKPDTETETDLKTT